MKGAAKCRYAAATVPPLTATQIATHDYWPDESELYLLCRGLMRSQKSHLRRPTSVGKLIEFLVDALLCKPGLATAQTGLFVRGPFSAPKAAIRFSAKRWRKP
jgi:hypothetical protein